jgi:hypothetical protein
MLASAMVLVSTAIAYPTPDIRAGQRPTESDQHCGEGQNLPAHSRRTSTPPTRGERVCAGHRPVASEPDDCQNKGILDTPTGYIKRASDRRFRWSEALSRTRWQVKDSNLRSSRDGFTVLRRQGCDQRKRLTRNNFRAYSPPISDVSQCQPDTSGLARAVRTSVMCAKRWPAT